MGDVSADSEPQIQEPNTMQDSNSIDQESLASGVSEDHTDQLEGLDEPILGTHNHDIDESGSQYATNESEPSEVELESDRPEDEAEQTDPVDRPANGAEAFMARAEIELPGGESDEATEQSLDEPSDSELLMSNSELDEPTVKSEPSFPKPLSPEMGAVESEEKDKLIASLQSKIPSLANKDNDSPEPEISHGQSLKPGSVIGSKPVDEPSESGSTPKPSSGQEMQSAGLHEFEQEEDLTQTSNRYTAPGDQIPRNRGTAHFRHSRVKLPKGVKIKSGDELTINGRPFVLRPGGRDLATVMLYGTLAVVLLLLVVSQTVRRTGGPSEMPAIGVVTDQNSGRVLADVEVTITELGRSVTTNDAGIFVFDLLPPGSYTLTAKTPFYKTAGLTFDHTGSVRSVVPVELSESTLSAADGSELKEAESTKEKKIQYGDLKVITNLDNSEIFIDNRSYGKGSRTIRNVYPGKHKLVIKADGYETYSKTVRVNENGLTTIDAQLAKIKSDKPVEMSPEQYVAAGQSAFESGDFRKAVESYTLALLKEKNADWYYMRGQAYLKGNRPADAKKDFVQAGRIYMSDGKVTSSISAYTTALDLDPSNMMILRARGYAYIQNGVYDRALADFEQACEINDESYLNLVGRGDAYSAMGEYKDAIKYYKKAEEYTHDKASVYALIALANLARGDEGDARKYYEKFIEEATPEIEQKYAVDPEWQRLKQVALND